MRNTSPISTNERILILVFSFLAFAFFATAVSAEIIESYNNSVAAEQKEMRRQSGDTNVISFSRHDLHPLPGLFNLITFFVFLALLLTAKKYFVSTALTVIYGALLVISIYLRLDGTSSYGWNGFYSDPWVEFINKTNIYDYVASMVIVVLLCWQSSIIWRIYRSKSNGQMP
jgi:hypothetical protein